MRRINVIVPERRGAFYTISTGFTMQDSVSEIINKENITWLC